MKLGGGSLALAGLGLAASRPAAASSSADFVWSRAAADALVGQPFWLNHPELGAVGLTLEAVGGTPAATAPAAAGAARSEQFTLLFVGPRGQQAGQGSYELDHERIGRFTLLLVPGAPRPGASVYRSDFNLLA
ncbi:hypothetical protein CSQ96_00865 [Janthinobacterium sp. BJB412]|nr:hypothetical protein CSQ96_00865 [Janthinobacterium sp. BJB412]